MHCVVATKFGDPDVLEVCLRPDPAPGSGEVVIEVAVADTLHLDTVLRRGLFPFPVIRPPYVPGGGVAGVVVAVGAGVARSWLGRRVAARTGVDEFDAALRTVGEFAQRDSHSGGYAEFAVVPAAALVPVPAEVALIHAAALVNDGMTALLLVEAAQAGKGDTVLVMPAGGGLGSLLIQLIRATGARVVGAAGNARKLRHATEIGADVVVDYTGADWLSEVREMTSGRGVDIVLDGVGGTIGRSSRQLLATTGRFIAFGAPSGEFSPTDSPNAVSMFDLPMTPGKDVQLIARMIDKTARGGIHPVIGATLPLEQAATVHAAIESRTIIGKALLSTRSHDLPA